MKNILLALIAVATLFSCTPPPEAPIPFTNLIIQNSSQQDSVLVYVTLQAPSSVVGLFGIRAEDTIGSCSKGIFYAHKDNLYYSNYSSELLGVVISFMGDNLPCQTSIPLGFPTGINIFECSINTEFECFDISCEDGMDAMLQVSVSDTVNWTTGEGTNVMVFDTARNVFPIRNNVNIRGVFPYRCTDCIDLGSAVPQNCLNIRDSCSTYRTCQVARTSNIGGSILVQYLSGAPQICK